MEGIADAVISAMSDVGGQAPGRASFHVFTADDCHTCDASQTGAQQGSLAEML